MEFLLPIQTMDRQNVNSVHLSQIGSFGVERVARPRVAKHLHTGIDIQRPVQDYSKDQFIYPIAHGVVISKRTDGPFAQLILEHEINGLVFWTVYEHIADIQVELFQKVGPKEPIARFFYGVELDKIGWQFDHFHFEVLKKRPTELKVNSKNPERLFNSYTLSCSDKDTLDQHFYNPLHFLEKMINK
ncbi:MAG: hypothetical protein ABJG78_06670 [Cyclobacteriaceae bacterium]